MVFTSPQFIPACPDLSGIYREGLGAVLIKVEWEITICPKPLLRPDISGKGLKEWSYDQTSPQAPAASRLIGKGV